ncbi:MAG: hypothetical protein QCI38_04215, partial [Candidatus Thermoplasmatota archaeon]|nr:hypothetical protein [Candidatus Thermoplasmatota archaeon]
MQIPADMETRLLGTPRNQFWGTGWLDVLAEDVGVLDEHLQSVFPFGEADAQFSALQLPEGGWRGGAEDALLRMVKENIPPKVEDVWIWEEAVWDLFWGVPIVEHT